LSGDFLSPDYGDLWLKSHVQRARDIVILNIYRPHGTSSFVSYISLDSDYSDFFSASPEKSAVLCLLHHTLLDTCADHILLVELNLYHILAEISSHC
jgi:hypothetical protein